MPIRSVPCASAGPDDDAERTRATSTMTMRLMTSLLGDEMTTGDVAGGHGMRGRQHGQAVAAHAGTARRERATRRQGDEVRGRPGNGHERLALLTAPHRRLHQ